MLPRSSFGSEIRRGVGELDGTGEAVGGIVIMRFGENALDVIQRVKQKIGEVKPSFPEGVELKAVYDRSNLIDRSIHTLKQSLIERRYRRCAGHHPLLAALRQFAGADHRIAGRRGARVYPDASAWY